MILQDVVIGVCVLGMLAMLWQHLSISQHAYKIVAGYTRDRGVNLLDQSILLKRVRLVPSINSLIALKRTYAFEFSTLGDERYPGQVVLIGKRLKSIELAPFKTDEPLEGARLQ